MLQKLPCSGEKPRLLFSTQHVLVMASVRMEGRQPCYARRCLPYVQMPVCLCTGLHGALQRQGFPTLPHCGRAVVLVHPKTHINNQGSQLHPLSSQAGPEGNKPIADVRRL